jgi:hypothetical protein
MLSSTPPLIGRAPPLSPVPAPLTVSGIICSLQILAICEISLTELGFKITSAKKIKSSVSSCPYFSSCSLSELIFSLPTIFSNNKKVNLFVD